MIKVKNLFSVILATIIVACGGGNSGTKESAQTTTSIKTYGIFRPLKTSIPATSVEKAVTTSINQSLTMSTPRQGHKAIMLDDGRILLIGGETIDTATLPTYSIADFFNPITERFASGNAHSNIFHRYTTMGGFAAIKITEGIYKDKILLAGGIIKGSESEIFELYDPILDVFTLPKQPLFPSLAPVDGWSFDEGFYIGNDKVLLCGSHSYQDYTAKSFVVLDMTTWTLTDVIGSPTKTWAQYIKLPSGNIVCIGGYDDYKFTTLTDGNIYQFNISDYSVSILGHINIPRAAFGVSLLDGTKLGIYGGITSADGTGKIRTSTTEIYDLATNISTNSTNLLYSTSFQSSIFMQNQFVLNAGGADKDGNTANFELVQNPFTGESGLTGKLITPRRFYSAITLNNGTILISGGENGGILNGQLNTAEIYDPQAKLIISYPTDHVTLGATLQFSSSYPEVNWTTTAGAISSTGLFTSPNDKGYVTIKASAKNNINIFAEVIITVE